jgi:hypothetical protein
MSIHRVPPGHDGQAQGIFPRSRARTRSSPRHSGLASVLARITSTAAPSSCATLGVIDYYAPDMESGSEDPADPDKTMRIMTIMRADEY